MTIIDNRADLYLVYRVSGAQDKMEFFETYRGKPVFDSCGNTNASALAKEPYLRSEGLLKAVQASDNRLDILYTEDRSQAVEPSHVHLSTRGQK